MTATTNPKAKGLVDQNKVEKTFQVEQLKIKLISGYSLRVS